MAEKTTPRERAAAPRSRGERSRPPPLAAPHPAAKCLRLLETERGDRDVGDVVAELLERVMEGCARASAARQAIPVTVGWARDTLLLVAQMRFPERDEGDSDAGGAWQEDEEPAPPAADSWAQGFVPLLRVLLSPEEVSGRQDPPAAPEAESPPAQAPRRSEVPGANLPCPELLREWTPPAPPPSPPRRARPPAPRPAKTPRQPGSRDVERGGVGGVPSPLPPPPACPRQPPCSRGVKPEGSVPIARVPARRIRPQVEVLDPGAGAEPPAGPQGVPRHSGGSELGVSLQRRGHQPRLLGSLQLPRPLPQHRGSLPGWARRGPGLTPGKGPGVPAHGEEEEEEGAGEAEQDLRPIRPAVLLPAMVPWQLTGDREL